MNKQRLLQIADHLESGKLLHKNFDFTVINANLFEGAKLTNVDDIAHPCGTNGCAIGELPAIWPEDWTWISNSYGKIIPRNTSEKAALWKDVENWFDIDTAESSILFIPHDPNDYLPKVVIAGIRMDGLPSSATKEEVAANIRKFVSLKEKEENENSLKFG
jgi:hypothetical protein